MRESSAAGSRCPHPPPVTIAPVICLGDSGINSGDTSSWLVLPAARNWTEETWIQSCKTGSFDHMVIIRSSALMPNPSLLKIGPVIDAADLTAFEAVAR